MAWELNGNGGTNPSANWLGTNDQEPLVVKTGGREAFRVNAQGRVGVGTQNPAAHVEVVGNWDGSEGALRLTGDKPSLKFAGGALAGNQTWLLHVGSEGPGNFDIFKQGANPTSWDNVMTLTPAGIVGIGTNNPPARANGKLVVEVRGGAGMAAVVGVNDVTDVATGGNGGWFESATGEGVRGWSKNAGHGGVVGINTVAGIGVFGNSAAGVGVWGTSDTNEAIHAETKSTGTAAIAAYQMNPAGTGAGIYAESRGHGPAASFKGNVVVTGDVVLTGADCAEHFDVANGLVGEPGSVMVIDDRGALTPCGRAYDKRVAGVISGAGALRPGIILDGLRGRENQQPLALIGKVYCKVDADISPIEVGDLLTTSPTAAHAMKVVDPAQAFGSVIGKALAPLSHDRGLVPILICLH